VVWLSAAGIALLAVLALALVAGRVLPTAPTTRYTNPVLDRDFPDPAVLRASDGRYYAYATQSIDNAGRDLNIQVARSSDLAAWEHLGEALPRKPAWASTTQDFWAPHVVERDGRFVMYYSANPNSDDGLCLAVAVSNTPTGPFIDRGSPLECGESFVNIDPMAFRDPLDGTWLLFWGSAGEPIRVRPLGADGLEFAPLAAATAVLAADPIEQYENLIEGAWVVVHESRYYLFYSGDSCCVNPNYAVLVARSSSARGPYEKLSIATGARSSAILAEDSEWDAPGHAAVVQDGRGQDWLAYHAVNRDAPFTAEGTLSRRMLIDPIDWVDGWPRVHDGTPSSGEQAGAAP
jgi:arabinan endo-1,5-alpha-L-arabinosidase